VTARTLNKTPIHIPISNAVQFQGQGKHICQNIFADFDKNTADAYQSTHQTSTFLRLTCKQLSSSSSNPDAPSRLVTWRRRNWGQVPVDRRWQLILCLASVENQWLAR